MKKQMHAVLKAVADIQQLNHLHLRTHSTFTASLLLQKPDNHSRAALCQNGRLKEALDIFHFANQTYAWLLQCCANMNALSEGKMVHSHIIKSLLEFDIFLSNNLITMYVKCWSLKNARQVFDKMPERNDVSWNAIIAGCAQNGNEEEALHLFSDMQRAGWKPSNFTFGSVIKACAGLEALERGKQIHAYIINTGFMWDAFVGSGLVDMYARCGSIEIARQVFDKIPKRNVVSWNAMIARYAQMGNGEEALKFFSELLKNGMRATYITFVCVVSACAKLVALEEGKQVHALVIKTGFEAEILVRNNLVNLYAKCGNLDSARNVFDKMSERDVVSWNAIITGTGHGGHGKEALELFYKMQHTGTKPNQFTFGSVLSACAGASALGQGKQVHTYIVKTGFESDVFVGNALIDAYAKCKSIKDASRVFDNMIERNTISWNAIIAGYSQTAVSENSLTLFCQMLLTGLKPDQFTFASVLSACANLTTLEQARQVQAHILKNGFMEADVVLGNTLIDVYTKCGSIEGACKVFDEMPKLDMFSWTSMVVGYAQHGHGNDALQLFEEMQQAGMKPNDVTFIGVLFACSQIGLVDKGVCYFDSMDKEYSIRAREEHYACVVDLLGRAGYLEEAHNFIKKMPFEPGPLVWRTMLSACRKHGNLELGRDTAEHILDLEPYRASTYVLLSNIYAAAGRWDDVAKVRKLMKDRGLKKEPGCSWVEVKNKIHTFVVGDRSHPQTKEIYEKLEGLILQMKRAGYVPDINFVLQDVEQVQKEHSLYQHSEKLAIVFGIINTPPGTPLRIIKNLRVCGDCHTAIKFISRIVGREIVVRDANRFHHWNKGLCSCGDYW